ncbi:hypothetical protein FRC11_000168, partial [Ceratobasidium sp. 423]
TYSDGTVSSKHGGGGHIGTEYEFTLAIGEHISEMLIWIEGDWLFGLQFITTTGRCSPQYGVHWGIPSVARPRGGVLVGFLSHTKLHPQYKEMFHGVQGIWRYDLVPRVPKEDDVYSEYFGDKNQNGRNFNDRVLVGNSSSIRISSVEVWSGEFIDSIQFTYTDNEGGRELKSSTLRHGGPGGSFHQFVLEDGEHIVTISGRQEVNHITQLCFGTNRGRTSEVFGGGGVEGSQEPTQYFKLGPHSGHRAIRTLLDQRPVDHNDPHTHTESYMNPNDNPPADNNAPLPPEFANNQGENPNDRLQLVDPGLYGFRINDMREPQVSAHQVASYVDGAAPSIKELTSLSTEIIVTDTEREANYAHRGWSIGAIRTISPWISSRIAANCQSNAVKVGYTKITKTRRLKVQVLLGDLVPVPEFEAAVEDALGKPTMFEKFQAVYHVLSR